VRQRALCPARLEASQQVVDREHPEAERLERERLEPVRQVVALVRPVAQQQVDPVLDSSERQLRVGPAAQQVAAAAVVRDAAAAVEQTQRMRSC
jgi:hypothetical protein